MSTTTSYEPTARTLLNIQLVSLHRQGKAIDLADPSKALRFLATLPTHDQRLSRFLQESHTTIASLRDYLQESLEELALAENRELVPMLVPVPPDLELTMGYTGQAQSLFTETIRDGRYLGFYWSGSKVYWEDGLGGQTDNWSGYLAWYYHWTVSGSLGPYHDKLGSDDGDIASHEWILDRRTRLIYITPQTVGRKILHDQWPKEAFPNVSVEEAMAFLQSSRQSVRMPTNEEVMQLYRHDMEAVAALTGWLEKYFPMPIYGQG